MAIVPYLAMTAAEIQNSPDLPSKIAWMACHFSAYGKALSNLPQTLPPGSVLMVDDSTPIYGHDPALIAEQLCTLTENLECSGVLLDFQRPGNPEAAVLAQHLSAALPCPIAISEQYAKDMPAPVFLSPAAPSMFLKDHLSPWVGRDIWLDISPSPELLCLTPTGCDCTLLSPGAQIPETGLSDKSLHCHYHIRTSPGLAEFTLWRTKEDLEDLSREAETMGVVGLVGLYQELTQW